MPRFRVAAAVVVAKVSGPQRQVYCYRGAALPSIVPVEEAERLVKRGLVVRLDEPEPEPVEDLAPDPDPEPETASGQARRTK